MKYVSLVLVVLAAGCETGGPESNRIIRVRGVGWCDPTTYALVSVDPNGGPDSPENQLLVQKLGEALQKRGFRPADASQAEQIIQVRYRSQPGSTDGDGSAGVAGTQQETQPGTGVAEPVGTSTARFSISLTACDGPTLRFTSTRVIEMWSLTAEVTNVSDAEEAIPILADVARRYLATETVGTIKMTDKTRAVNQPATAKTATAS